MKNEDYDSSVKKISRRQFLNKTKYAAKIAGMSTAYGVLGNVVGRVYETERDALRNIKRGYDESVEKLNPKNWYDKLTGKTKNKIVPRKEKTRRGFIKNVLHLYNEYPVPAFTSTGIAYGSGKQAIRSYNSYRHRLDVLENKLTHARQQKEIRDLTQQIKELKQIIQENFPQKSKLERNVNNININNEEQGEEFIALGFAGILIAFILTSANITGNLINQGNHFEKPVIGTMIFVISLITLFLGIKKKK